MTEYVEKIYTERKSYDPVPTAKGKAARPATPKAKPTLEELWPDAKEAAVRIAGAPPEAYPGERALRASEALDLCTRTLDRRAATGQPLPYADALSYAVAVQSPGPVREELVLWRVAGCLLAASDESFFACLKDAEKMLEDALAVERPALVALEEIRAAVAAAREAVETAGAHAKKCKPGSPELEAARAKQARAGADLADFVEREQALAAVHAPFAVGVTAAQDLVARVTAIYDLRGHRSRLTAHAQARAEFEKAHAREAARVAKDEDGIRLKVGRQLFAFLQTANVPSVKVEAPAKAAAEGAQRGQRF